ncbi:hypothetical protein [Nonomuraea sp. NPDC050691]|uniref:hypothetical protein n=1 Tax=Nonomuraea sp. NPDC050691 TaxID=3155661 RepID=UPI0033C21A5C
MLCGLLSPGSSMLFVTGRAGPRERWEAWPDEAAQPVECPAGCDAAPTGRSRLAGGRALSAGRTYVGVGGSLKAPSRPWWHVLASCGPARESPPARVVVAGRIANSGRPVCRAKGVAWRGANGR